MCLLDDGADFSYIKQDVLDSMNIAINNQIPWLNCSTCSALESCQTINMAVIIELKYINSYGV